MILSKLTSQKKSPKKVKINTKKKLFSLISILFKIIFLANKLVKELTLSSNSESIAKIQKQLHSKYTRKKKSRISKDKNLLEERSDS